MKLRSIVFDLDGTLVDSVGVCVAIFREMLVERGCTSFPPQEVLHSSVSLGGEVMIRRVFGTYSTTPKQDLVEFRNRYAQHPTPPESLYTGVREILTALKSEGIGLAVCTKKPTALATKVLAELALVPFFQVVSCADAVPYPKPDRRHLLTVLAELNCQPAHALMVGDSRSDFDLARDAEVPFGFARYGYGRHEVDEHVCDVVLESMSDLFDWVTSR